MTALGIALLLVGATLVVAEAHVPGGVLGIAGGVVLMLGGVIVIAALGGTTLVAVPIVAGLGLAAVGWALLVTRKAAAARRERIRAGTETLPGRVAVVRSWNEPAGQVFLEGALWRARHDHGVPDDETIHEGDSVVVERVNGLTLCVRRADEWELIA